MGGRAEHAARTGVAAAARPLNLYDFACWARGTVAPLLIVLSHRPRRPLPFSLDELVLPGTEWRLRRVEGSGPFAWADHLLKLYDRSRFQPGRRASRRRLVRWISDRQEADGSWGGIQPPWVYSLIALHLEGMPLTHPLMRRGLAGLQRFAAEDRQGWRLQACMSPVWDTALAILALRRAGVPADAGPVRRAVGWLLDEQILGGGDWQVRCAPGVEGGGWAFEFDNDIYPDVDDTTIVVLALLAAEQTPAVRAAIERARQWVLAMRSSNGAWAAFDRDNVRGHRLRLPFADFGAMLDPPSEDVTAHAVEMLAALGEPVRAVRRWLGHRLPPRRPATPGVVVRSLGCQPPVRHLVRGDGPGTAARRRRGGCQRHRLDTARAEFRRRLG